MTSFVMAGGSSNSVQSSAFSLTLTDLCCLQHSEPKKADSLSKNTSLVKRRCQTLRQEGTSIRRYKSKPLILDVTFLLIWHFSPKRAQRQERLKEKRKQGKRKEKQIRWKVRSQGNGLKEHTRQFFAYFACLNSIYCSLQTIAAVLTAIPFPKQTIRFKIYFLPFRQPFV